MYELAISLLNQYVEVYTYLTKDKLYGEIISATPYEIILLRRHIDKASNKNYTLYIPLNSVIYIKIIKFNWFKLNIIKIFHFIVS